MSATRKYFGTDGVRHRANSGPLAPENILRLAKAAGAYFKTKDPAVPRAVIGRDTRLSGDMIEAALIAGLSSTGIDISLCGVVPTPATALMARDTDAGFGVMITASHNQFEDNGIKFFGPDGCKLSDADELAIEALMEAPGTAAAPSHMGRTGVLTDAGSRYIVMLSNVL